MKSVIKLLSIITTFLFLSGCASMDFYNQGKGSVKVGNGPGITGNHTPYTASLMCTGNHINSLIKTKSKPRIRISVGEMKDLTGKYDDDGGYRVTQGTTLMMISALGKSDAVKIVERTDTKVFAFEVDLAGKKLVSDTSNYKLPGGKVINYRPLLSGSVIGSNYYITGGVTELNYNIRSGGVELDIAGFGGGRRQYVMNVAMDVRLVNTKTLAVVYTTSLQKQIVGYETKLGMFRFFDSELVDTNMGNKVDEPLQLGIRAIAEDAVTEILANLYGISEASADYVRIGEEKFTDEAIINPRKFARDEICPEFVLAVAKTEKTPKKSYYGGACSLQGNGVCRSDHCYSEVDASENQQFDSIRVYDLKSPPAGHYVQMSSFKTVEANRHEWACLEEGIKTGPIFNGHDYLIRSDNGTTPWHTLLVGPKTRQKSEELCKQAKDIGLNCYVRNIK